MLRLRVTKKLGGGESGVTLIETLVALAVLGLIAVVFLSGLATAARATLIADEQATAESLARSEIEYVKSQQPYINYAEADHGEYGLITSLAPYTIEITVEPIDPDTGEPRNQTGGIFEQDDGIQRITVKVNRGSKLLLTLEGYKVDR